jgi:anti-anti-sigma regulatory factor
MSKLCNYARTRPDSLRVIAPPVEIDILNADALLYQLMSAARSASIVVLDMTATAFCDSLGFLQMVVAGDHLRANGGDLRVICSPRMHMLMKINKDDEHFSVFSSLIEALDARSLPAAELVTAA